MLVRIWFGLHWVLSSFFDHFFQSSFASQFIFTYHHTLMTLTPCPYGPMAPCDPNTMPRWSYHRWVASFAATDGPLSNGTHALVYTNMVYPPWQRHPRPGIYQHGLPSLATARPPQKQNGLQATSGFEACFAIHVRPR